VLGEKPTSVFLTLKRYKCVTWFLRHFFWKENLIKKWIW